MSSTRPDAAPCRVWDKDLLVRAELAFKPQQVWSVRFPSQA